ncbi:ribonuclease P protein component [Bacilli bacterium PM5-3]|nr:ribonuclease P protein component [Bacilli bacterium PM5-3]MDH6604178.1 ribonuclease P protein component [Bacilli bacterium PM5-9]
MKEKFRLKKNNDFKRLIDAKKYVINKTFTIYFLPNNLGYSRFGISVGKKHGNAVMRNKIKRQLRMMISQIFVFNKSYDYVIMIRNNYHNQNYSQNLEKLEQLSKRIETEV